MGNHPFLGVAASARSFFGSDAVIPAPFPHGEFGFSKDLPDVSRGIVPLRSTVSTLEERVGSATSADRQFVWGARYIDDLVLRDRGSERLYALKDVTWNMTSIVNTTAVVQERYSYTAYGSPTFLTASFTSRSTTSFAWETLFRSYRFDIETGLNHVRLRDYHPVIGNWCQRDPAGYSDGMSLYSAWFVPRTTDPFGDQPWVFTSGRGSGHTTPNNTTCSFVMNNNKAIDVYNWTRAADEYAGTNVLTNVTTRSQIVDYVTSHGCCNLVFIGHRGGGDNPGGIVTGNPQRRILPDAQLEQALSIAMKNCQKPSISILSCSSDSEAERVTQTHSASIVKCPIWRPSKEVSCDSSMDDWNSELKKTSPGPILVKDWALLNALNENRPPLAPW